MKKIILIFLYIACFVQAQDYNVSFWNIPIGSAELFQVSDNAITLKIKSNELIDYISPIELEYSSIYDRKTYSIIENNKTAKYGSEKQQFEAHIKNNVLIYSVGDTNLIEPDTHSILSLLTKFSNSSVNEIDTKWFNLENEGILYKARFLWNDSSTVKVNSDEILCDHYRFDLKIVNDDRHIFDKTDYFNELFFDINSIRQIWVEKWQTQQRIIKITIKNNLKNLAFTIKN